MNAVSDPSPTKKNVCEYTDAKGLKIIYTPETDHFRFDDISMHGRKEPGDPSVDSLRKNYEKLRQEVGSLPQKIGIVTYCDIFKKEARKHLKELQVFLNTTTTYSPLDIFENALELRKEEDIDNAWSREYVSRSLYALFESPFILLDKSLSNKNRLNIFISTAMPAAEKTIADLKKFRKDLKGKGNNEIAHLTKKIIDKIRKNYPSWDDLQKIYNYFLDRFEANKVSRGLPLYFYPPGSFTPSLYSVSLMEEIEKPAFMKESWEIIEAGAKAQGLRKVPESVKSLLKFLEIDRFGETERKLSLDGLMEELPNPKTLITDLYIVDQFPQLRQMEFETAEFEI